MKGQIVKISSDLHFVNYNGDIYPCKCRGLFRKEHITPVVGDYVLFSPENAVRAFPSLLYEKAPEDPGLPLSDQGEHHLDLRLDEGLP